ncbi:MAG: enoyl-CoA hydratase/isomerase family protein, partial [archaeon]|nr:enoyl-CoA hydratase/isomerase family protein [archaeon]
KVKVVVLKSTSERVFSAGFDLNMFKGGFNQQISEDVLSHGRDCSRFIYFLKKPVIAQMDGSAIGMGCIMALACDFRIVADKEGLFFQLPEINISMTGTTGPTFNSVNVLGVARAKEMLLTGRKVDLKEMDKWGGITQICPPEELDKTVRKFARNLASKPAVLLYTQKVMANIMGKRMAEDAYKLENEMADYWFSPVKGDIDEFFRGLWEKYGTGSPKK